MVSGAAAQVEAVAGPHATRSPTPLLQVGMRRPHCCIVSHVVVRCEQLDFSSGGERDQSKGGRERVDSSSS